MSARREGPGIRLTVPADLAHTTLIRACLRDAVGFASDDQENSFLVAVTEVVVNAIEATRARPDSDHGSTIAVELFDPPDACVVVSDAAGGADLPDPKPDHLGAGLAIAGAFVDDLHIDSDGHGTRVRLGLDGATG